MARRVTTRARTIDFKAWLAIPSFSLSLTGDNTFVVAGLSFSGPGTILRTRGRILLALNPSGKAADDNVKIAFGLGLVSTDAFTLGATAMPDPAGEPEYPWLWWGEVSLRSMIATTNESGFGPENREIIVDTKAMRKIKPGMTLTMITQYVNLSGNPIVNMEAGQFRTLIGQ